MQFFPIAAGAAQLHLVGEIIQAIAVCLCARYRLGYELVAARKSGPMLSISIANKIKTGAASHSRHRTHISAAKVVRSGREVADGQRPHDPDGNKALRGLGAERSPWTLIAEGVL